MSTTPPGERDRPPVASAPTLRQAGAFFALLCDMGFDRALDRLHAARQAPPPAGDRPTSLAEAAGVAPRVDAVGPEPVVQFDLGEVFRQVGYEGAYPRLAACIYGLDEDAAAEVSIPQLRDDFFPFAVVCAAPLRELQTFVLDWA